MNNSTLLVRMPLNRIQQQQQKHHDHLQASKHLGAKPLSRSMYVCLEHREVEQAIAHEEPGPRSRKGEKENPWGR